ncbi:MAG: phosphoenolpyruvate--protein phosphotransferase [Treponemataceae bacterium]|nr:MAG: phosphoenolpyruvate--protein phosphotransferase [Treponemataceae bacterium]
MYTVTMTVIEGLAVFEGIAAAKAYVIQNVERTAVPRYPVTRQGAEEGCVRLSDAAEKVKQRLKSRIRDSAGDERLIFETHVMILEDVFFFDELCAVARKSRFNIESVLDDYVSAEAKKLRGAGNAALAERADDILDVFGNVLQELLRGEPFDAAQVPEGSVVVAKKLSPSDALCLFKRHPAGLCLAEGGVSGHLAILTRAARVPAVFAAAEAHKIARTGDDIIIDGAGARVFVNPDSEIARGFQTRLAARARQTAVLSAFKDTPCLTRDGERITLLANIGTPEEAYAALSDGAQGIGLFRTEFLFMEAGAKNYSDAPDESDVRGLYRFDVISEDAQYEAYKTALQIMKGKPVVIRALDAGGDKFMSGARVSDMPANPLLGRRSIRFTLAHPDIFKTQLRALLRAGVHGDLRVMLPLVVSLDEIKAARALIAEAKKELAEQKILFKKNVPVGIMVETAAAALSTDALAKKSDFFSIGTNDLTQYSLAIDRENPEVAPLYDEFHLAILRLIKTAVDNAKQAGIPVSVCGEMAGHPAGALALIALGADTLSMTASSIQKIKYAVSRFSKKELADMAKEILCAPKSTSAEKIIRARVNTRLRLIRNLI